MNVSLINSQSILRLLSLTERKEELLQLLEEIDAEIVRTLTVGVSVDVFEIASAPAIAAPAPKLTAVKTPAAKAGRKAKSGKTGGTKAKILALLEEAGAEGLHIKDIAAKLGSKTGNISVWFSTTGKNITTKVAPGRFAKKGAAPAKSVAAPKPANAAKVKKSKMSSAGRAKISAMMKARWAARKAGKPAAPAKSAAKPAKKGFKLSKGK